MENVMGTVETKQGEENILAKVEPTKWNLNPQAAVVEGDQPITGYTYIWDFGWFYSGCQHCHCVPTRGKFLRIKLHAKTAVNDCEPECGGQEEFVICGECMELIVEMWNSVNAK